MCIDFFYALKILIEQIWFGRCRKKFRETILIVLKYILTKNITEQYFYGFRFFRFFRNSEFWEFGKLLIPNCTITIEFLYMY